MGTGLSSPASCSGFTLGYADSFFLGGQRVYFLFKESISTEYVTVSASSASVFLFQLYSNCLECQAAQVLYISPHFFCLQPRTGFCFRCKREGQSAGPLGRVKSPLILSLALITSSFLWEQGCLPTDNLCTCSLHVFCHLDYLCYLLTHFPFIPGPLSPSLIC